MNRLHVNFTLLFYRNNYCREMFTNFLEDVIDYINNITILTWVELPLTVEILILDLISNFEDVKRNFQAKQKKSNVLLPYLDR